MCYVIIAQLSKLHSHHSINFQTIFGLFLNSNGCSCQTINALHHCGLCLSFDSIQTLIQQLSVLCIFLAMWVAHSSHVLCWDNVNMSTSMYVEQCGDMPMKVQSGTMAVIYRLNYNPNMMHLAPIMQHAKTAGDLQFALHICPTFEQAASFYSQQQVIIVHILTLFSKLFQSYAEHPKLQHKPHRANLLIKIAQFPLQVSTINEAMVEGTIKVLEDIYEMQL